MKIKGIQLVSVLLLPHCASMLPSKSSNSNQAPASAIEQPSQEDRKAEEVDGAAGMPVEHGVAIDAGMKGSDSLELRQAQLWARVDELEAAVKAQKAKIKLLEKGLMLGVVPEGMEEKPAETHGSHDRAVSELIGKMPVGDESDVQVSQPKSDNLPPNKADFDNRVASAKELFKSGNYGKAYLEFSRLDKEFGDDANFSEQKYWLGRCWYQMKEYQTAIQSLKGFTSGFPASPWATSAKFFMARSEIDSGLKEAGVKHLQEIIREHPYEGTAEAAKQLIGNLEKSL